MLTSLDGLTAVQKEELVASLATLLVGFGDGELTAEALQTVASASGNSLSDPLAALYSSTVHDVRKYMTSPGGGGGGAGTTAAGGTTGGGGAAAEAEEEKEEEMDLGGGMDMFGGDEGGGGGGDY